MQYVFFSKMVREFSVERLIDALHAIGADGVDLCVRDGYPVTPATARKELPRAAARIRAAGLAIPLVTAPTTLTNAASPESESLFVACHDSGVPNVKVGYWPYEGAYWKAVDSARKDIEGFAGLAQRFGVRACLHTHSGNNLGLNASSMMHLARGSNPLEVGVYLDAGHLGLDGEPPPMAIDIAGPHLALVAFKDSFWEAGKDGGPRMARFVPIGQGAVEWRVWLRSLAQARYAGPISFHSEYEGLPADRVLDQTRKDIAYIRRIEAEGPGR